MTEFSSVQTSGRSLDRDQEFNNTYSGKCNVAGGLLLPVRSSNAIRRPSAAMRLIADASGCDFPSGFSEHFGIRVDVYVTDEGFLVHCRGTLGAQALHRLQDSVFERFGVCAVPFDLVRLPHEKHEVELLRLLPVFGAQCFDRESVSPRPWKRVNPKLMKLVALEPCPPSRISELASLALHGAAKRDPEQAPPENSAAAPTASIATGGAPSDEGAKARIRLCNPREMQARIAREPHRNNGNGSLPVLTALCSEKSLVIPDRELGEVVGRLSEKLPNFGSLIDFLKRKTEAQSLCAMPVYFPPILLLGGAGVGKSYFCRMLSAALGMPFHSVGVAGSSQELHITGLSKSWGSAGPSRFSEILAGSPFANPLIMVDEIDKTSDIKVQNALLQIMEPETSVCWVDQYVEVPIDLSRVMFIATANDLAGMSPVLLSRFEVFEIEAPDETQMAAVLNSIYVGEQKRFGIVGLFSGTLPADVTESLVLSGTTPREARRLLGHAMENAVIRTYREYGGFDGRTVQLHREDMPQPKRSMSVGRIGFI